MSSHEHARSGQREQNYRESKVESRELPKPACGRLESRTAESGK
jgi:hypothetical protein